MRVAVPRHGHEAGEPGIELVSREVGKVGLKLLGRGFEVGLRGLKEQVDVEAGQLRDHSLQVLIKLRRAE